MDRRIVKAISCLLIACLGSAPMAKALSLPALEDNHLRPPAAANGKLELAGVTTDLSINLAHDITVKKAPGSSAANSKERDNWQLMSRRLQTIGAAVEKRIPDKVFDALVEAEKFKQLLGVTHFMEHNQIRFMIDDISRYPGVRDTMLYPREDESKMGALSFLSMEDGIYYIHVNRAAVSQAFFSGTGVTLNEEDLSDYEVAFLAQLVAHEYSEAFAPPPTKGSKHNFASKLESYFSSKEARHVGISDLDLFYLRHAVEMGDVDYLYNLIYFYDPAKDPEGYFKQAVFQSIRELQSSDPEGKLPYLTNAKQLSAWYIFQSEAEGKAKGEIQSKLRRRCKSNTLLQGFIESTGLDRPLADTFEVAISGRDIPTDNKVDPLKWIFAQTQQRLGADPRRTVVVEDSVAAIREAKKNGFGLIIGIDREGKERQKLLESGAHIVVESLNDIDIGYIDQWFAARGRHQSTLGHFFDAIIFGMGGVITDTRPTHALAWKSLFDRYLLLREKRGEGAFEPFTEKDYLLYVDGLLRYDGAQAFLKSRGIDIPFGNLTDPSDKETVVGLSRKKNDMFLDMIGTNEYGMYTDALNFIIDMQAKGIRLATISASKNTESYIARISRELVMLRAERNKRITGISNSREEIALINKTILLEQIKGANGTSVRVPEAVCLFMQARAPFVRSSSNLLHYLRGGRIRFMVDDLASCDGIDDPFLYPTDDRTKMGTLSFIEKREDGNYYIHVPKKTMPKALLDGKSELSEHDKAFLAQLILLNYAKYFRLGFQPHESNRLQLMHFASVHAMPLGVTDINLFYLNHAVKTRNVGYLYHLIADYDIRGDPGRSFMKVLLSRLDELRNHLKTSLPILTEEDLLAWYEFQFRSEIETFRSDPEEQRSVVATIGTMLGGREESVVRDNLPAPGESNRYLFGFQHPEYNDNQPVFLPQGLDTQSVGEVFRSTALKYTKADHDNLLNLKKQLKVRLSGFGKRLRAVNKALKSAKGQTELLQERRELIASVQILQGMIKVISQIEKSSFAEVLDKLHVDLAGLKRERAELQAKKREADEREVLELNYRIVEINRKIDIIFDKIAFLDDWPMVNRLFRRIKRQRKKGKPFVIGIQGPSRSGTSHLSMFLTNLLSDCMGLKAGTLGSDGYLHIGYGFRYDQKPDGTRVNYLEGPGIYNRPNYTQDIAMLKSGGQIEAPKDIHGLTGEYVDENGMLGPFDVVIIEGPYVGITQEERDMMDLMVAVCFENEGVRLARRIEQDSRPPEESYDQRRQLPLPYLVTEFTGKIYDEGRHVMNRIVLENADLIMVQDVKKVLVRSTGPKPAKWGADVLQRSGAADMNKDTLRDRLDEAWRNLKGSLQAVDDQRYEAVTHDYSQGPLAVARLAYQYEELKPDQTDEVVFDIDVAGVETRMSLPIPKAENPIIIRDYLLARIYNILVITGTTSIRAYAPVSLKPYLEAAEHILSDSPESYDLVRGMVQRTFHNEEFHMYILDDSDMPEANPVKKASRPRSRSATTVRKYLADLKVIPEGGLALGIDIGGTDAKLAVGEAGSDDPVFLKEHLWQIQPKRFTKPRDFKDAIVKLLMFALAKVSLDRSSQKGIEPLRKRTIQVYEDPAASLDEMKNITEEIIESGIDILPPLSIGISFPDVVVNNQIVGGLTSKTTGMRDSLGEERYWEEFLGKIRPLARLVAKDLKKKLGLKVSPPARIANDGEVGAKWAAVTLGRGGIVNLPMGTSVGGGLVGENGKIPVRLFEPGYMAMFIGPDGYPAYRHQSVRVPGSGQQLLSQQTVFRSAIEHKLIGGYRPGEEANRLEHIQSLFNDASSRDAVKAVFDDMGEHLALAIATIHYAAPVDSLNTLLLFGRVVKGDTGAHMVDKARLILTSKFKRLKDINLMRPSEMELPGMGPQDKENLEALAQVIGALYLGNAARIERESAHSNSAGTIPDVDVRKRAYAQIESAA